MSAAKPGIYGAINVHAERAVAWPEIIPQLTAVEAEKAARRLWRFSVGTTFDGVVNFTSGNRRTRCAGTWMGTKRLMVLNPDQGWRDFVHELSHDFDYVVNGSSKHGKHHQRFEAKLIREVIKRGWLDGKLRDKPKAAAVPVDARQEKLARIEARILSWERKAKRAKNALAKLTKQQRYYVRVLTGR
jgi:hypothetical protein